MGTSSTATADRSTLALAVDLAWRRPPPRRSGAKPRAADEPPAHVRPLRCRLGGHHFLAAPGSLPLPDASVARVVCAETLEFVRDDERLIDEIARVLAPGGTLILVVPNAGRLAGFDAFNLFHYLVDVTKRGVRPPEVSDIGWRRHYAVADLHALVGTDRFAFASVTRRRFVVAELVLFLGMLLFRWLLPSPRRYRTFENAAAALRRWESRFPVPGGFELLVEARRVRSP